MLFNIDRNLHILETRNLQAMSEGATIIWLHFCAFLLPKTDAIERQIRIIMHYNNWAASLPHHLASLHYMRVLAECILN